MSVVQHLEELRSGLIVSGVAWIIGSVIAFIFHTQLLTILERPITGVLKDGGHLVHAPVVTTVTDTFTIPLEVSATAGFMLALPVVLWQGWKFIAPGLRPVERKFAGPLLLSALLLFILGATFAYFIMPIGLNFLAGFLGDQAVFLPDLGSYLTFFAVLILIFGITFELPVLIILLGMLGMTSSKWLRQRRKGLVFIIVFVSFVITPGADPFTPTALALPLIVFFEASILILDKAMRR